MTDKKSDKDIAKDEKQDFNFDEDLFFKTPLNVELIHSLPPELMEPGYDYRPIIMTYTNEPFGFRKKTMEENGWEIVYTEGNEIDHRGNAPKTKPNIRKAPLIVERKSGHKAVWMRIKSETRKKLIAKRALENELNLQRAVKVTKTPESIKIQEKISDLTK